MYIFGTNCIKFQNKKIVHTNKLYAQMELICVFVEQILQT
jgi:hypothetical protein